MVPPTEMLTTKKRVPIVLLAVGVALLGWSGCTPAGPRSLLKGEKLLEQGRYADAVRELEKAVVHLNENAQAWNHLGLAYHYSGQTNKAVEAYQHALRRDRNLAPAYYNSGVLHLELNNLPAAVDALTTFTVFRPGDFDGWLKLATAQLRHSAQLAPAEKNRMLERAASSMATGLRLRSNPESLNIYGLILARLNRIPEAIAAFNTALQQQPNYAPALLNLAILYHQQPQVRDPRLALRLYNNYLKLPSDAAQKATVENAIAQLQQELAPPPVAVVADPAPDTEAPQPASPAPAAVQANQAPSTVASTRTGTETPTNRINMAERPETPPVKPTSPPLPVAAVEEKPVETPRVPESVSARPAEETVKPAAQENRVAETRPVDPAPVPPPIAPVEIPEPVAAAAAPAPLPPVAANPAFAAPSGPGKRSSVTPLPGVITYARYTYRAPAVPVAGNRREAERFFRQGLEAQQQRRPAEALAAYRRATELDPSFFEAFSNMGVAAFETGQFEPAAQAYERAVALRPASSSTRYNFAMALMRANYPADAAKELARVVEQAPSDARAHLALANVYAQQLYQVSLARQHYQRVVELEPRHPEALRIRYWLAANP
jgi:tetratricopeptide (TPR) repeat protein